MAKDEGLSILHRIRRLHAMALGLYMCRRMMGEDGGPQKKRLRWLENKILNYQNFEKEQ